MWRLARLAAASLTLIGSATALAGGAPAASEPRDAGNLSVPPGLRDVASTVYAHAGPGDGAKPRARAKRVRSRGAISAATPARHAHRAEERANAAHRQPNADARHDRGQAGGSHREGGKAGGAGEAHEHGVETENLFGFTLGSDTEEAGAKELALESVIRTGKRGTYRGLGQKLEFSFGVTDDFSLSFALLGDYHRVRAVPGFDDIPGRYAFNGFGTEVRWRLLDRKTSPFGLTLHLEPSVARIDEVTGQAGRKLGSENKLIFDQELIPDTLFGAVNLLYDIERMKERRSGFVSERSANIGVGGALAYRVADDVFVGGEARYLRAYEGFSLKKWQGHAVYLGPTLFAKFLENGWLSLAWNIQVAGREAIDRADRADAVAEYNAAVEAAAAAGDVLPPAPIFPRRGPVDLVNFERHQFRVKVGFAF
jgi:hypothetical protein